MSKSFSLVMILTVAALGLTAPLSAQARSALTVAELEAAVAEQPSAVRMAVQEFLATERAQALADGMGTSVSELSAQVAGLDDAFLTGLAARAATGDEALAGGDGTIVITATTAIIILLLIIILVR